MKTMPRKSTNYKSICLMIFLLLCFGGRSQQITIEGLVLDESTKEPLPFVNFKSVNKPFGFASDIDGRYKVKVDAGQDFRISYVGYSDQVVRLSAGVNKTIFLKPLILK